MPGSSVLRPFLTPLLNTLQLTQCTLLTKAIVHVGGGARAGLARASACVRVYIYSTFCIEH